MKKQHKIFLTVTLAVTLLATIFILPASAADIPDVPDISSGTYLGLTSPNYSDWSGELDKGDHQIFMIGGISFESNHQEYYGFRFIVYNGFFSIQYIGSNNTYTVAYRGGGSSPGWASTELRIIKLNTIPGEELSEEERAWFNLTYTSIYSGSEYDIGYRDGLEDGQEIGYIDGYNAGFNDGKATTGSDGILPEFFSGVFEALDRFTFFEGFTLLDFIKGVLAIFALIWFLKLLAGG